MDALEIIQRIVKEVPEVPVDHLQQDFREFRRRAISPNKGIPAAQRLEIAEARAVFRLVLRYSDDEELLQAASDNYHTTLEKTYG